jgi:branched-chain amino acid aminotransferase
VLVGISRNAASSLNPEMKSGNFLNNLLARREARLRGAMEGIMLSPGGVLAEGATSNLFWIRGGTLETPALSVGILHGVTRAKVLEIACAAHLALPTSGLAIPGLRELREVEAPPARLREADEIFLTSTSLEVFPITRWEGSPVGSGRRGPIARSLRQRLQALYPV